MSSAPSRPAGPVDIAVIGFSGELRQGGIRQAIADAVGTGAVRVLDVVLVWGTPQAIRAKVERYAATGVTTTAPAILASGDDLRDTVRALAPVGP